MELSDISIDLARIVRTGRRIVAVTGIEDLEGKMLEMEPSYERSTGNLHIPVANQLACYEIIGKL